MKHDLAPALAERLDLLILAINKNTAAIQQANDQRDAIMNGPR